MKTNEQLQGSPRSWKEEMQKEEKADGPNFNATVLVIQMYLHMSISTHIWGNS